jgi:hypothetical protein
MDAKVGIVTRGAGRPANASTQIEQDWDEQAPAIVNDPIPQLTAAIAAEAKAFRELEQQAAIRGLRIGVLVMLARDELNRQNLPVWPWCRAFVPFSRPHIWRFLKIAESFFRESGTTLEEAANEIAPKLLPAVGDLGGALQYTALDPASKMVQTAFAFLGDKTLSEICDALGHPMNARKKQVADLTPTTTPTAGQRRAAKRRLALADWERIEKELNHWFADKAYCYLEAQELDNVRATLKGGLTLLPKLAK